MCERLTHLPPVCILPPAVVYAPAGNAPLGPAAPSPYQLAIKAAQERQLPGGQLDAGFISAQEAYAILQQQGALPARTLFSLARLKAIGDAGSASYSSVLSSLEQHLPAGVRFVTGSVAARGSLELRSDTIWAALSQRELTAARKNLKAAECAIAQERAERVVEQVGPALQQSEVGTLTWESFLGPRSACAMNQQHFGLAS